MVFGGPLGKKYLSNALFKIFLNAFSVSSKFEKVANKRQSTYVSKLNDVGRTKSKLAKNLLQCDIQDTSTIS